ncbi:MAG: 50S ribosomal protein L18 [bacterium]
MKKFQLKNKIKERRAIRARVKISGTSDCPRLSVCRSLKHISAQFIDDKTGKSIFGLHDKNVTAKGNKTEKAYELGKMLAQKAIEKKITTAVFDRGANRYHGRVKAIAEGAREGGLKI